MRIVRGFAVLPKDRATPLEDNPDGVAGEGRAAVSRSMHAEDRVQTGLRVAPRRAPL